MNEIDYRCKKCGTIVPPRTHHKMEQCACGAIGIDEGWYGARSTWPEGKREDWIEEIPKNTKGDQMTTLQKSAQDQLRQHIERIERLEQDRKDLAADIKDEFTLAKSHGFDAKIMRKVLSLRKKSKTERQEEEAILDTYLHALEGTPLGTWAKEREGADA